MFAGRAISGATILCFDDGLIERIRLYHYPYRQLEAFAAVALRGASAANPNSTATG